MWWCLPSARESCRYRSTPVESALRTKSPSLSPASSPVGQAIVLPNWWDGSPGPRGSPGPAFRAKDQELAPLRQADEGVGRGPGGPPHHLCSAPMAGEVVSISGDRQL